MCYYKYNGLLSRYFYFSSFTSLIYLPKSLKIILSNSANISLYYIIISDIFKVVMSLQNAFTILPFQQHCNVDTEKETGSQKYKVYFLKTQRNNSNQTRPHLMEKVTSWISLWTVFPTHSVLGNTWEKSHREKHCFDKLQLPAKIPKG